MSAWARVLDDVAARGGTPAQVATRLGLPASLVQAVLDQAERLGVVVVAGRGCGSGCPTGPTAPAGCSGCPLAAVAPDRPGLGRLAGFRISAGLGRSADVRRFGAE